MRSKKQCNSMCILRHGSSPQINAETYYHLKSFMGLSDTEVLKFEQFRLTRKQFNSFDES